MWNLIKSILKFLIGNKSISSNKMLEPIISRSAKPVRFAIIVGHNERDQGAINYLEESEWMFNSRIARKLQLRLTDNDFSSVILFRPSVGSYEEQVNSVANQCAKLGIEDAMCLHFNSYSKKVDGCEVLVADTESTIDNELADEITDLLESEFGIKQRHSDGVKIIGSMHRGSTMLYTLKARGILAVLPEPVFANFRTIKTRLFFESEEKYVLLLSKAICKVLG